MITKELFDTVNGQNVYKYTITDGITAEIIDKGATLVALKVKNKDGGVTDVALGAKNASGIGGYIGATVGRCANRIGGGSFTLGGKKYELYKNDGENTLHGGQEGFDKKLFSAKTFGNSLMLSYVSADGEENFPATLYFTMKYTVKGEALIIEYYAESHGDTVFAPTNHSYFNLSGEADGDICDNVLTIRADKFLPVDKNLIPTGEERSVFGTPFDFTSPKAIGRDLNADDEQLKIAGGYDHNFCITDKHCATAFSEKTGVVMDLYTDMSGVQFYSGNFLGGEEGKSVYKKRSGFCLETQFYPNAVNMPEWKSPVLKSGKRFYSRTELKFSVKK